MTLSGLLDLIMVLMPNWLRPRNKETHTKEEVMLTNRELDEFAAATSFALVDNASEAAFAIDGSMSIVRWNRAAQKLLDYTPEEVMGRPCASVLQAINSNGQPLCVPGCEGERCFKQAQSFAVASCFARNKGEGWVPVNVESVASNRSPDASSNSVSAVIFLKGDKSKPIAVSGQTLQIFTFGHFGLAVGGKAVVTDKWDRKQALTLLKFLLTRLGRAVHRDVLVENLWPDADEHSGRERLKVNVYALRRELRGAGMSDCVLETVGDAYMLRREAVWMDTLVFENCIAVGSTQQSQRKWADAIERYTEAQRLYRGDYLEEDIHSDWCAEERERLREVYLEMLANQAECLGELGDYAKAVSVCRVVLVDDPCMEHIHRMIMEYLLRLDRVDSAVAQYRQCETVLARELGVEPSSETRLLYERIMSR
jgi:PAS domain S-box-containing protein